VILMRLRELERANLRMAAELERLAAAHPAESEHIWYVLRGGHSNAWPGGIALCATQHRPMERGEVAVPPPAVAAASGEEGAALDAMRKSDALAELAGVSLEELARIRRQEDKL
jgi:hypothetical protein